MKADQQEHIAALEAFRRKISSLRRSIGNAHDYLDRGNPGPEREIEVEAGIKRLSQEVAELDEETAEYIGSLRHSAPDSIRVWCAMHLDLLASITAECTDEEHRVRAFVAREATEHWREVSAGTRDFVMINDYYLPDYEERLNQRSDTKSSNE